MDRPARGGEYDNQRAARRMGRHKQPLSRSDNMRPIVRLRLRRAPYFPYEGVISLPGVFLNEDDNFDIALRRFKKQVEKAGILSEMKKRQHYEKPSVMRKKKKAAARKRLLKKMRKINMG